MNAETPLHVLATASFEAKRRRRLELARLPIEQKLEILQGLQRMANDVRRAAGRPTRPEWPRNVFPRALGNEPT